jgi:hypothetical protein
VTCVTPRRPRQFDKQAQIAVVEVRFIRYSVHRNWSEMKNLVTLVLVAGALAYGSRSCSGPVRLTPIQPTSVSASTGGGGAARQWQQEPQAVMGMQDAIGGRGGSAGPALDAVQRGLR